jgi:hypothetical protein
MEFMLWSLVMLRVMMQTTLVLNVLKLSAILLIAMMLRVIMIFSMVLIIIILSVITPISTALSVIMFIAMVLCGDSYGSVYHDAGLYGSMVLSVIVLVAVALRFITD